MENKKILNIHELITEARKYMDEGWSFRMALSMAGVRGSHKMDMIIKNYPEHIKPLQELHNARHRSPRNSIYRYRN